MAVSLPMNICAPRCVRARTSSANKQLMSERYGELVQLARENHVALRCSAAVGGGIRWLTNLESTLDMEPVLRVSGIMNGTTNYILDTMTTSGLKLKMPCVRAQALGYAEVDPTEVLKVAKFGGSSMADAKQFEKVRDIVRADPARKVIVVSAAGKRGADDHKLTDLLYLCYAHLQYGVSCDAIFQMIADRYIAIRDECGLNVDIEAELAVLRQQMRAGISEEELVSRGEYFSALLMADYLGYSFLDAELWVRFQFDGSIDKEASYAALQRLADGRSVVIPGFYGVTPDGKIRTFSRGGSDITGALAAAALNADVYENWTDVSGILMADPRIVPDPLPIERITYNELRELSFVGAQVLHEGTVFPVREKNIPLNIRNTNAPDHPGTLIMESFDDVDDGRLITGIAGKKNYSIITIAKTGMSSSVGTFRQVFEVFERHGVSIEYAPSGIDCLSLVVPSEKVAPCLYSILGELEKQLRPDNLHVTENISIVAAVGRKMVFRPGTSGRIFAALGEHGINIRMISQGPDELNIIVGVDTKDFAPAIQVLYNSFVK